MSDAPPPRPRSQLPRIAVGVALAAAAVGVCVAVFGPVDPRVGQLLGGASGVATLTGADRVAAWRLDGGPWLNGKPSGPQLHGYPVLSGPVAVDADAAARLSRVLLRSGTYIFDAAKGCMFTPGVLVRFSRGDENLDALLCFSCDEVRFVPGGQEDFDDARPELVAIAQRIFPADPAIQSLRAKR